MAYRNAGAVTPHNTNPLPVVTRALFVTDSGGAATDVTVIMAGGETVLYPDIPPGTTIEVAVTHVKSTGTSATAQIVWLV